LGGGKFSGRPPAKRVAGPLQCRGAYSVGADWSGDHCQKVSP
jgi:hypothetical protein